MNDKKIKSLQSLRLIAFLYIFSFHAGNLFPQSLKEFFNVGIGAEWAVSLFIVLSGFLLGYRIDDLNYTFSFKSIFEYMKRKIKKIYPLFFITTCLAIPRIPLTTLNLRIHYSKLFLTTILLLQSWTDNYLCFNGVTWFLSTIIFLYLLSIPIICLLKKQNKKHGIILLTVEIISFLILAILWDKIIFIKKLDLCRYSYVFPISRISEYIIGILSGVIFVKYLNKFNQNKTIKEYIIFTILELLSFFIVWLLIKNRISYWKGLGWAWIIPNALLITITALNNGFFSKILSIKPFTILGNITFEAFLIHQLAIDYLKFDMGNATKLKYFPYCFILTMVFLISYFINKKNSKL